MAVAFFHVPLDFKSIQLIAIASAGFLLAGIPAAIFLKFLAVFTTAGFGAILAIGAAGLLMAACISQMPAMTPQQLSASIIAWVAITVVGMVFQYRTMEPKTEAK